MAVRNALMPFQLPESASVSALTNPLMQGMREYRQGMAQQFEGERALARESMDQERLGLARNQDARAGQDQEYRRRRQMIDEIGNLAVAVDGERDPNKRQQMLGMILQRHPDAANLPPQYRDPVMGPRLLRAEAGKARDELDERFKRAQIGKMNAEAAALGQKNELNEAVAGMIRSMNQPEAAPQSPIRPQSMEGAPSDPNIRLTQAGGSAQPAPDMINTPAGPMPRQRAQQLGLGLALAGKGDAGKMFAEAAGAGQLGKEGQNEIDKKMIAASENLTNLASVRAQFRPEFQQIENRLGMAWTALADKFKKGQTLIKPEDRAQLEAFSAYRSDALDTMNNYIKAITGAAMTDAEAKRILSALPAVGQGVFDGDGPTAFKAKLDQAYEKTAAAIARYNYARRNGQDWQFVGIEQMKGIVRNRGRQLEQELRQTNPNVDPTLLQREVTKRLKQEFGI